MTKVLVTGATGYVGTHVVEALADMGAEVIALSRSAADSDPRAVSIHCDFARLNARSLVEMGRPDVVIHMAWADGFNHDAASHIDNLPHHVRFVREVVEAGISQFVGLGTMHEIGYWEGEIDESTPTRPRSMYGIAKNALREAARLEVEKHGAIFQWLRPYYILGDDERNNSLFTKILRGETEKKCTFPFSSGRNQYDFIEIKLLARQIALASLQTAVRGVIECCSGKPVALRDQVAAFISTHGLRIRPEYDSFPDRAYDSPALWGSVEKISKIIKQQPNACL